MSTKQFKTIWRHDYESHYELKPRRHSELKWDSKPLLPRDTHIRVTFSVLSM